MNFETQKINKTFRIYKIAFAAISILLVAAAVVAFTVGFGEDTRYFADGAAHIPFLAILAAAVALSLSTLFVFGKCSSVRHTNRYLSLFAILPAIMSFRYTILLAELFVSSFAERAEKGLPIDSFSLILVLISLFPVAYYAATVVNVGSVAKFALGSGQIVFCLLVITSFYTDYSVELNSPVKLLMQFSAAAMILCVLSDIRELLGTRNAASFAISRVSSIALGISTAAALFAVILPNVDKYGEEYTVLSALYITVGINAAVELFTASMRVSPKASEKKPEDAAISGEARPSPEDDE